MGKVAVPKIVQKPPSPRGVGTGVPVGKVAVPKTGQKTLFATPGCPEVLVGKVAVPMDLPRTRSGPRQP